MFISHVQDGWKSEFNRILKLLGQLVLDFDDKYKVILVVRKLTSLLEVITFVINDINCIFSNPKKIQMLKINLQ